MVSHVDRRPLMLKFRLHVTRRMPKSEAMRLLKQAVRTGFVPNGIEIHWMDWAKGEEGHMKEGRVPGDQWHDLQNFYGAIVSMGDSLRAEKVDQ